MLVDVPVSSMNTSRSGSSWGWLSTHAVRAAATSGRSCSAFEADAMTVEEPPDRANPRLLLTFLKQTVPDLFQSKVGFLLHQPKQPVLMFFQRRSALTLVGPGFIAAGLPKPLRPADRRRISDHKLPCCGPRRRTALNHLDHANSQIVRIPHRSPLTPRRPQDLIRGSMGIPSIHRKWKTL